MLLISFLVTAYTLPPDKLAKAIEYARARNRLYFIAAAYGFLVLAAILYWKVGPRYRDWAERVTRRRFLQAYIFAPLLLLTIDLLELPIAMRYHQLAVRYEQSIQPWGPWFVDWAEGRGDRAGRGGVPGVAAVRRSSGGVRGAGGFTAGWRQFRCWCSAVFVNPLIIEPLFYRFTPLANTRPALASEIEKVTARGGLDDSARPHLRDEREREGEVDQRVRDGDRRVEARRGVGHDVEDDDDRPDAVRLRARDGALRVAPHLARDRALVAWGSWCCCSATYHALRRFGVRMDDYASLPALLLAMAVFDFFSDPDRELAGPHPGAQRRHLRPRGDPRHRAELAAGRGARRSRSWARSGWRIRRRARSSSSGCTRTRPSASGCVLLRSTTRGRRASRRST